MGLCSAAWYLFSLHLGNGTQIFLCFWCLNLVRYYVISSFPLDFICGGCGYWGGEVGSLLLSLYGIFFSPSPNRSYFILHREGGRYVGPCWPRQLEIKEENLPPLFSCLNWHSISRPMAMVVVKANSKRENHMPESVSEKN